METMTKQPLEALVEKLEKRNTMKRDFIVPSSKMHWANGDLCINTTETDAMIFKPTELFETQIADKLGIPNPYFRKMKSQHADLLQQNVNGWLEKNPRKNYMVRTYESETENIGRAFLSNSYNIIDDYEVLFAALEAIKQTGVKVKINTADVTENRLYLSVTCPEIEVQAEEFLKGYLKENEAAGNGIISGFIITNSEVGKGAFEIRPRAVICKCNNGLIVKDERFRRVHLGSKLDAGEIVWSDRTRAKNRDLIVSQVSDAVKTYLSADYLGVMIEKIAQLKEIELKYPIDAVQNVCKTLGVGEEDKSEILKYFLEDGDHRASGILNAVTRQTQKMDLDLAFEIEGNVVDLMFKHKSYDKPFSKN